MRIYITKDEQKNMETSDIVFLISSLTRELKHGRGLNTRQVTTVEALSNIVSVLSYELMEG